MDATDVKETKALGIVRGAVFLFHEDSGVLQVDAALGIADEGLAALGARRLID